MMSPPTAVAPLTLFCFPCAGGSASSYRPFVADLAPLANVVAVELPGHGVRLGETAVAHLPTLIDQLLTELQPQLQPPFAFWGHSMGALLAFELARKLRREGAPLPTYLFASAHRAPQLPNPDPHRHLLPNAQLVAYLQELGGTPPEITDHPEMLDLILPVLRADLTLLNTYSYTDERPLDCPIMALGGVKDAILYRDQLQAWQAQTSRSFKTQIFPGGHFYLYPAHKMLMQLLRRTLEEA